MINKIQAITKRYDDYETALNQVEKFEKFCAEVGMTKTSIADAMGISRQSLETSLMRGLSDSYRQRIQKVLKERAKKILSFRF